eukprot:Skav224593  [mRNA]  locus=scaffold2684:161419:184046:- [translate_table: standard]
MIIRLVLALPLLQAARPPERFPGVIDQALERRGGSSVNGEMKRLSNAIKNGDLDAAANLHWAAGKAHPANLMQQDDKGASTDDQATHHKSEKKFFKEVAASHAKLDHALKSYSQVADKDWPWRSSNEPPRPLRN